MIKYETIISNFDDKTTLYNWLRKVEEALKNASATNFVVNKKGNATLSFSITFADGTTLESGDIVLQQGESVDGARIASGVLQLHLTNGTWLTAGNLGAVSGFSIDASQHLIVTYQDGTSQDLGAIFNGNVNINGNFTANSIIENMSGYSALKYTTDGFTTNIKYTGVVKNGNKITFACVGEVTRTALEYNCPIIQFIIPASIGAKLYPINGSWLALYRMYLGDGLASGKELPAIMIKNNNESLRFDFYGTDALTQDTKYYFRWECTFLLSDSLYTDE